MIGSTSCLYASLVGLPILGSLALYWGYFAGLAGLTQLGIKLRGYTLEEFITVQDVRTAPRARPEETKMTTRIPRILHRTWRTRNVSEFPPAWRACSSSGSGLVAVASSRILACQRTDEEGRALIRDHYPWFLPTYDGYRYPIQRVDAFRYFLLYHYGGVYLDMDIGCTQRLDPLVAAVPGGVAVFPQTKPQGVSNDLIMAPRHHPFLLHLTKSLVDADRWYGCNFLTVLHSTGPSFLSKAIFYASPALADGVRILETALYENGAGDEGRDRPTSFFFHRGGSTWHGSDAHFVVSVVEHLKRALEPFKGLDSLRWMQLILLLAVSSVFGHYSRRSFGLCCTIPNNGCIGL
eukprot:TRINITY_DN16284_c0_g1_i1.p1 TRINITY_DN16284_c0_g1~~TRINITY_DN16284_c0_g1_i1.p1  ORF type:complete len:369 (-),score=26.84 TRINITY_DN16284_c0_g1_i1:13-1062(-)